jgi:hypothetical protein
MSQTVRPSATSPLVGKWFFSPGVDFVVGGYPQGHILAAITPEVFLVQLYEGDDDDRPVEQRLVLLSDMLLWCFFDTKAQKLTGWLKWQEDTEQFRRWKAGDVTARAT